MIPLKQDFECQLKKLFLQFLKNNKALNQYKINLINSLLKAPNKKTNNILTSINPIEALRQIRQKKFLTELDTKSFYEDIIALSFIWANTKEGYSYWAKLDEKWKDILKTEIEKYDE